jgi:hypothetical protein
VTRVFVTLQRAPPLTRIFAPRRLAPSSRATERFGWRRRVKIAAARPAAPAPTIATSEEPVSPKPRSGEGGFRRAVYAALVAEVISSLMNVAASLTGTVEIAPHALHRTVRFVGSSDFPMTSVRWLPHFGQTGGAAGICVFPSFVVK